MAPELSGADHRAKDEPHSPGASRPTELKSLGKALVITEFPTMDDLLSFYNNPEYQNEIKPLREGTGNYEIAFYES